MKYLRHIGLVFSLLIVGVLGGLMAPLPSEAHPPSLTISVDTASSSFVSTSDEPIYFDGPTGETIIPPGYALGTTIANGVGCTAADDVNYSHCYKIRTYEENGRLYGPPGRKYKIVNAIGTDGVTQDARLLIEDATSNGLEKFTLTGVRIAPCATLVDDPSCVPTSPTWATDTSKITVTIKMKNTFNVNPNDVTNGTSSFYRFALSVVGVFKSNPTPINNTHVMRGTGKFGSTDTITTIDFAGGGGSSANTDSYNCSNTGIGTCRMFVKVSGPVVTDVRLNKEASNSPNYPGFACNNGLNPTPTVNPFNGIVGSVNGNKCTPEITLYLIMELFGTDIVNYDGSPKSCGGNCGTPGAPSCSGTGKGKKAGLEFACKKFIDDQNANNQKPGGPEFGIADAIECTPDICNGIIRNVINVTPTPDNPRTVHFVGTGPDLDDFTLTTSSSGNAEADPFIEVLTRPVGEFGPYGTSRTIALDPVVPNSNTHRYEVTTVVCTSGNGTTVQNVDYTTNGDGPEKGPVQINAIGNGDVFLCTWHVKHVAL